MGKLTASQEIIAKPTPDRIPALNDGFIKVPVQEEPPPP